VPLGGGWGTLSTPRRPKTHSRMVDIPLLLPKQAQVTAMLCVMGPGVQGLCRAATPFHGGLTAHHPMPSAGMPQHKPSGLHTWGIHTLNAPAGALTQAAHVPAANRTHPGFMTSHIATPRHAPVVQSNRHTSGMSSWPTRYPCLVPDPCHTTCASCPQTAPQLLTMHCLLPPQAVPGMSC
jgi:hypothetical protein